jgi:hypothetical protein
MISFDSYANYASTVDVGATNANLLIPARYSSLKTHFTIFRLQSNIGLAAAKTISQRANPITDVGQWYYSIGGKNVPSTPVKSDAEAFAELSKALHAFSAIDHTCMITNANWVAGDGTYIIATDLETMAHKSKLTESGINTLSSNTHLISQFGAAIQANIIYRSSFRHFRALRRHPYNSERCLLGPVLIF